MQDRKHIAILIHERMSAKHLEGYFLHNLTEYWKRNGYTITVLCGTKKYIPADILFLHVDLSVVPKKYLKFAKKYPIVINKDVLDIRKSVYSKLLLSPDTDYIGPVIVKSDLNYFGKPELKFSGNRILRWFLKKRVIEEYKIYNDYREVPKNIIDNSYLVIEKFLPETDGENYYLRTYMFLGDREVWVKRASKYPVVKGGNSSVIEQISPEPKIIELRKKMKFDYGKFDYIVYNGEPILLDANKTIGKANNKNGIKTNESLMEHLASGISKFLT